MNTNRDLNYRLYLQREEGFHRISFSSEFEKYKIISSGDVKKVRENIAGIKQNFYQGLGTLSKDPVKNVRYHLIVAVALISRVCVENGMSQDLAYTLSDIYIQRADECAHIDRMIEMIGEIQLDYAERMRDIKKEHVGSIHVRKCMDYIYEHLHSKINESEIAEYVSLSPSYISRLFKKEVGVSLSTYIAVKRVETAQNMLKYSDYPPADIGNYLAFTSHSHFISVFRKYTGMPPNEFRKKYYRDSWGNIKQNSAKK